jgi:hypothetical protein
MRQAEENNDLFHTHVVSIGQEQESDYHTGTKLYCILVDSLTEYQEMQ